jgi:hypothetical protein
MDPEDDDGAPPNLLFNLTDDSMLLALPLHCGAVNGRLTRR